jgi:iron complex transport system substrate-binding protein
MHSGGSIPFDRIGTDPFTPFRTPPDGASPRSEPPFTVAISPAPEQAMKSSPVRKPEHQWETRLHRAVRLPELPADWRPTGRDEAFALHFADGRTGSVVCGLHHQRADAIAATDPDLVHAIRCWLAARGSRTTNLHGPASVLDAQPITPADLGRPAPEGRVARVVTLAPSNADVLEALGGLDRLVACEDSSEIPFDVERLGPDLGPDLARVEALAPDLTLSSLTVPGMERVVTGLRARGLPQVVLAPRTFADVIDDVRRVGTALEIDAEPVVADLEAQRRDLEAHRPARRVRVYLEWWPRPMFAPARDCFSNELIALAGGVNVFGDREGSSIQITAEELVAVDPEICFISWCGVAEDKLDPDNLRHRDGLQTVAAVAANRIHPLDERFSGRPGPRMLEAARRMAAAIRSAIDPS